MVYYFLKDATSTHMLILNQVDHNSKVLDIGCAGGYLGEYLIKQKKCEVYGIEPDTDSAQDAQQRGYVRIINKNAEEGIAELAGIHFDYIILADVLEHLVEPELVLQKIKNNLAPNGKVIISLPNIAHYSVRLSLLLGRWNMKDCGIMDKTHLHFYTLKTAKMLIERCGLEVLNFRPRGDLETWFKKINMEWLGKKILFGWSELFAVQFIFLGRINNNK